MIALVLSGGGAKGSFQAGALNRVLETYSTFDYVSGVSVGALNGALFAQGRWNDMLAVWNNMSNDEVFTGNNPLDIVRHIGYDRYALNTAPLWEKVQKYVHKADFKIPFSFGFVSRETGKYYSLTPDDFADDANLQLGILASSAFPDVFPEVKMLYLKDGTCLKHCIDGGLAHVSPLGDVVDKNPDTIIELSCQSIGEIWSDTQADNNIVTQFERDFSIMQFNESAFDRKIFTMVNDAAKENGGVVTIGGKPRKYINLITVTPSIEMNSLNFNDAKDWMQVGYADADSVLRRIK